MPRMYRPNRTRHRLHGGRTGRLLARRRPPRRQLDQRRFERLPRAAGTARSGDGERTGFGSVSAPASAPRSANKLGRIPVLEYHSSATTTRSTAGRASFRADLEDAYARGYRPITMAQLLDKDFRDVPAGMSPVVFVFDDASPEQFRYVERNGKLEIDPTSGSRHLARLRASRIPAGRTAACSACSTAPRPATTSSATIPSSSGQKKEWRFQKVKWLADNGFELCGHTLWHARLDKFRTRWCRSRSRAT